MIDKKKFEKTKKEQNLDMDIQDEIKLLKQMVKNFFLIFLGP
jgi:hypothetical protein